MDTRSRLTSLSLRAASLVTLVGFGASVYFLGLIGADTVLKFQGRAISESSELATQKLVTNSADLLERTATQLLDEKAKDVALQMELLKGDKPLSELYRNPKFNRIAIQKVGKTGYTCAYECVTGTMRAHPNPQFLGKDMRTFASSLPQWWKVFGPTLDCSESRGFYDWKDPDGAVRKKFMTIYRVGQSNLMIAATVYLDEFTRPMMEVKERGRESIEATKARITEITRKSRWIVFLTSLLFLGFIAWAASRISKGLVANFSKIRNFAYELSVGNYNVQFPSPPWIQEFRMVFSDLTRMRDRLLSIQNERTEAASSAMELKLSRQVAHDLRSPLSVLGSSIKTLKLSSGTVTPAQIQILDSVAQRLREMVDSVLRPRTNYLSNVEKISLHTLIEEILQIHRERWSGNERQITFDFHHEPQDLTLIGSAINLHRALSNLIQNAAEAIEQNEGRVEVSLSQQSTYAVIQISDTGKGIPREHLNSLFQEGFTWGKRGGSGLGLYLCQQVISEHGGTLNVESEVGKGTTLTVKIPLPLGKSQTSSSGGYALSIPSGKRLLVFDDSVLMLTQWFQIASRVGIEGDYYSRYEEAPPEFQAVDLAKTYGLVILDHLMPTSQFNGISLAQELKKKAPGLPIVICTSDAENPSLVAFCQNAEIPLLPKTYFSDLGFHIQVREEVQ